jgi:hypothetical protein
LQTLTPSWPISPREQAILKRHCTATPKDERDVDQFAFFVGRFAVRQRLPVREQARPSHGQPRQCP